MAKTMMMIAKTEQESIEMKAENLAKLLNTPSGVKVDGEVAGGDVRITSTIDEKLTIDVRYDEGIEMAFIDILCGRASSGGYTYQESVFPDKEGDMMTRVIVMASVEFGIEALRIERGSDERVESGVKFDFENGWQVS